LDCAITARLLNADKVTVVYRRTREEAPANREELNYCESIGINFIYTFSPINFEEKNNKVNSVKCSGTRDNSEIYLETDKVILALGQKCENFNDIIKGININNKNFIVNIGNGKTNIPDIFIAGDIVENSEKIVVRAVESGKIAAESIIEFLNGGK